MTKPIELYYWPTPNGWKISIALEEMGLPYEVNLIDIGAGDQFKSEFLNISPNNRIPAIVDPDGPEGAPISVFESGAILQYLARKTGLYHGQNERDRVAVDQWLMWQMGGVGPMAGQAHHFLKYAPAMTPPNDLPYAKNRYRDETGRLYGILNRQLERHEFVAGDFFSIADMALWPWVSLWRGQQQILDDKPNLDRWLQAIKARPAVQAGRAVAAAQRSNLQTDKKAQELLFKKR
ncbi:MAG: glutathione S-transferase N-terminal domain-containing protein [Paracoccaceae bacterium]|jgi:GST-like protein|nr:glutathione S-transferase [Marinovum sp.]MBQ66790.1 glutathione S-transferase [Marinovum sp.]MDG2296260.1 glutathione S-transferase N-terminal domain-containing protein [Paracoccaceae bacterium]|tara:strand:+ start:274 stop:978 length:705 start_codon:yes stop_codon:yes gene_type:complete